MPRVIHRPLDSSFYFARRYLGIIAVSEGRWDEAIASFEAIAERERGSLAHALGLAGRIEESRDAMRLLELRSRQEYVSPVQHALAHLGLGDGDRALASLERGLSLRTVDLAATRVDPRFAPIRSEARFQALLRGMNLPVT